MADRELEKRFFWVQLQSDSDPAVALHQSGVWRLPGVEEEHVTADFYRIGQAVDLPADAFLDAATNDDHIPEIRR
jgi:hypothetical protein